MSRNAESYLFISIQRYGPDWLLRPGVVVIGLIAETATGRPYADLLRQFVFRPAKLRRTSFPTAVALPRPFIHGYLPGSGGKYEDASTLLSPSGAWASGAMAQGFSPVTPAGETQLVRQAAFTLWWPEYERLMRQFIHNTPPDAGRLALPEPNPDRFYWEIEILGQAIQPDAFMPGGERSNPSLRRHRTRAGADRKP